MAEKEYRKIGGFGYRREDFITWIGARLWMAKDHLLLVERRGYTEKYKRFYYRDIQAILVRRTESALYWTIFYSLLIAFGIAWEIFVVIPGAVIFWWIWIGFFAFLLVVNLLKGPACISHIQTAVQTEQIPPFNRIKKTRKALDQLREFIASDQGILSREEVQSRLASLTNSARSTDAGSRPSEPNAPISPAS